MRTALASLLTAFALFGSVDRARADGGPVNLARCVLVLSPEIDCPGCEDGIKRVLTTARGVQSAEVDVLTNKVTVRYDPTRINVKALIGRIAVTGYTAKESAK